MKNKDNFNMEITKRGEWVLKHPNSLKDSGSLKWWAKIIVFCKGI